MGTSRKQGKVLSGSQTQYDIRVCKFSSDLEQRIDFRLDSNWQYLFIYLGLYSLYNINLSISICQSVNSFAKDDRDLLIILVHF